MKVRHLVNLAALCFGIVLGGTAVAAATSPTTMRHYQLLEHARLQYAALAVQPALTRLPSLPKRSLALGDSY
ncbi:MAG TPA: hypothetical protein VN645_02580, partial [Steroidobacteraceae bacterium]|nr:hypothetical protein [Steroidobacteraceae bacterium]